MQLSFEIYPRLLCKGSVCEASAVTEVNTLRKINEEIVVDLQYVSRFDLV